MTDRSFLQVKKSKRNDLVVVLTGVRDPGFFKGRSGGEGGGDGTLR